MSYRIRTERGGMVTAQRVTEVIRRGLPSPQLEAWKMREVVRWALDHPTLTSDAETVAALIAEWEQESRRGARRGTSVHRVIAAHLSGAPLVAPVDMEGAALAGYLAAFSAWRENHVVIDDRLVEQTLLSPDMRVAGTADLIDAGCVYDWKTSEKASKLPPWPAHLAQLGAYASMRWLVEDSAVVGEAPAITSAAIVRLHADGTYFEHRIESSALLEAKGLWRHVRAVADAVKGMT